ncbi:hypothetical protein [Oenococcus kitaharae]|uniref:Uncharacterized protein n=1 Tax=Oenococcus kitaharae DSM 17330 TaxID=1045004 RepID=G9WJT0_9LACO|nr:hypothetical protein [Oenococcus kitaharae]EHN59279.1 hypothetical protein OKIT_1181 [Oenococcus kitaharae DSM 17330]OEY82197.1 hypothetical protein NT96_07430 [Oenococcus kitaharae]OEY82620.1 hypothetical protein NV75_07875 [Oenococcus kitaharae]OEY84877.1 hypothetical protein NT95_00470 [Oenococcus kitaharae]
MIKRKSFVLAEAMLALTITTVAILFISDLQLRQQTQISELQTKIRQHREQLTELYDHNEP